MKHRTHYRQLAVLLMLLTPLIVKGQQPSAPSEVSAIAPAHALSGLLRDRLAGFTATSEVTYVGGDRLADIVPDRARAFQEYRISAAASRYYGSIRVDVFQTPNPFKAFGLFTYSSGEDEGVVQEIGSGGALVDATAIFWKEKYFVRVAPSEPARAKPAAMVALARAVASLIGPPDVAVMRPPLLDSLPALQMIPGSERYLLGPESLSVYVEHGREMFEFPGDAEAAVAEYNQSSPADSRDKDATPDTAAGRARPAESPGKPETQSQPFKLIIVEYHTPQFATDAFVSLRGFVESLPDQDQNRILFRREGNYIVEAVNVQNRELAEAVISSIQYPYTVKWLRNPLWPTNDPFRMEKTADMLLSTFGLLGLILLTVLLVGSTFGATVFLKRRKRQQEIFSDAGGMLRLDIDPFESTLLGLPPKRNEE